MPKDTIAANSAAHFINEFLYANKSTPYSRAYSIENALRELARRNEGRFTIAESNTNPEFRLPE
jgi:hypothetical protein